MRNSASLQLSLGDPKGGSSDVVGQRTDRMLDPAVAKA